LYSLRNIIRFITSLRIKLAGHAVRQPEGKKKHLDEVGADGTIKLKRILNKYGIMRWTGFI